MFIGQIIKRFLITAEKFYQANYFKVFYFLKTCTHSVKSWVLFTLNQKIKYANVNERICLNSFKICEAV